jgi:arsenate reductase
VLPRLFAFTPGVVTIAFVCTHNAGRSQMAAAFFNAMVHPSCARAISAGTEPATAIHPVVIEAMAERKIDLATATPRRLTREILDGTQWVITMGCGDDPATTGLRRDEWQIADPAQRPLDEVRQIRDEIERKVWKLIVREGWVRLQPRGLMRALIARKPQ